MADPREEKALAACPFCGDRMKYNYDTVSHVIQGDCIIGVLAWGSRGAAERWNRRAALPPEQSAAQQPATDVDRLSAMHANWELHWGPHKGDESDCCWQVHRVNGGRNDREWTLIGIGETPRAALNAALSQLTANPAQTETEHLGTVAI